MNKRLGARGPILSAEEFAELKAAIERSTEAEWPSVLLRYCRRLLVHVEAREQAFRELQFTSNKNATAAVVLAEQLAQADGTPEKTS